MSAKEYLEQIRKINYQINNKLLEISQLRLLASCVNSCNSGERVQSTGNKDRMGDIVTKMVDKEKEIDSMVDILCNKKETIITQLEGMENKDYYNILFNRYVAMKDLTTIAEEMKYSYRQITRMHGIALKTFEKMYLNKERASEK